MKLLKPKVTKIVLLASALTLAGCNGAMSTMPQIIDTRNDTTEQTMGLDYRDFEKAASQMVTTMLNSGAVNKQGGGRYVLAISRVRNDTTQRIDTDQLVKKIRIELMNSGKTVVTTAVGLDGAEDQMTAAMKELQGDDSLPVLPDLSFSGKIIERRNTTGSGKTQIDYYFQGTLTSLMKQTMGLAFWEGEVYVGKRGTGKSVNW